VGAARCMVKCMLPNLRAETAIASIEQLRQRLWQTALAFGLNVIGRLSNLSEAARVETEHTFTVTVCDSCKRSDEKWSLRMLVAWLRTVAAKCVTSVAEAIVFCGTVAAKLATDLARAHTVVRYCK
jgi:hypothetical protein